MHKLAQVFRTAQFYAHASHNLSKGDTFFADHEYLGELYSAYEAAYDSIIERMIGLGESFEINTITLDAATEFASYKHGSTNECFDILYGLEKEICDCIDNTKEGTTFGTQNLLQGLADESEMRQYKLGQRLK
jgi:DNA-binding ferritin-like protein